ncbi:MAG TPA: flagellar hook-length control protein FliK [Pararhizobium sp.]|uniref:flagellar hook-length control protein FliK n=1 Tax=Pararhizobium sp. TaxID=1977563 RepID=UPI002CA667EA|nr:flagellar hook-length control protein FliK [Pararhizobium sp.]HTO32833.1 flagellar hook-length control protein FliK [Pararhizobium sp.]
MTTVDDNLLAANLRSAKSGSKLAGKHHETDAAKQHSAFENAFADAGKKKQPSIAIDGKADAEATPRANIAIAQKLTAGAARTATSQHETINSKSQVHDEPIANAEIKLAAKENAKANSKGDARTTTVISDDDKVSPAPIGVDDRTTVANRSTVSSDVGGADTRMTTDPLPVFDLKSDVKSGLSVADDTDLQPAPVLSKPDVKARDVPSISLQHIGANAEAGKTGNPAVGEKVADLIRDPAVKTTEANDAGSEKPVHTAASKAADHDAPAATDVSHLLTLLSPQTSPAPAISAPHGEATPTMSEFHALAVRAGKATTLPQDATTAKTEAADKPAATTDTDTAASADTDQIFRFARADGKGQAVSMNVASDGDKAMVKNDVTGVSAKAETVTVVEARRYLGLAPASNASAVTSQIVSNPEWAKALQSTEAAGPLAQDSTGKVLNTLKIQMHPIDLGTVTATLRLKEDELHVELKVETGDAFRQFSDDQNAMVKALRAQGFAVDQVSIVFNAPDSSDGTTQQQAQSQTGQQGREASADGTSQGKGQRNDNGSQQQSGGRWTGNEGTSDPSSGTDANRTGDVYM